MPMDAPATLVWIAPQPPDGSQSRAMESWGRARGIVLVAPREERTHALTVDPKVGEDVETLLDRARDAIAARDGDAADRAIGTADALLRAHPELPQGAWLMAEVERARSTRLRRVPPLDDAAADRAWARAEAIDGGRVAGLGEQAPSTQPSRPSPGASPATIALDVTPADAGVWLDGAPVRGGAVDTHAGPHLFAATWNGAPVWAEWVDTPAGSSSVRIVAPVAPACSVDDVSRASVRGGTVDATGVRCPAWVAAAPGADGVLFATCEREHCGPLLSWHAPGSIGWQPPPEQEHRGGRWPSWATWGLVGAGAVVATAVVIVASGVLKPAPTATQFVSGGVKSQ